MAFYNRARPTFEGESFEEPDGVVAARWKCSVRTVSVERHRRGISHVRRHPRVEDWGTETFADPDDVVAARHRTTVHVTRKERYRRGIHKYPSKFSPTPPATPPPGPPASGNGFTVCIRGMEVRCDSLASLAALLDRYGGGDTGVSLPLSTTGTGSSIVPFGESIFVAKHRPCSRSRCRRYAPILASGNPAAVCEMHACAATQLNWKRLEEIYKRPTVYTIEKKNGKQPPPEPPPFQALRSVAAPPPPTFAEFEMELLKKTLARHDGNQRAAARELQMSKSTLNDKLRQYELVSPKSEPRTAPAVRKYTKRAPAAPAAQERIDTQPAESIKAPPDPKLCTKQTVRTKRGYDATRTQVSEGVVESPVAAPVPPPATSPSRSVGMDDVLPIQVRWLWHHRVPAAMLTLIYAPPGVGKSMLTAALASAVSKGSRLPLDDQERPPAAVLFVVAEDNPNMTLRPRLGAAGADFAKIRVFGPEKQFEFPKDIASIEADAVEMQAKLIVIDPLRAFVRGRDRGRLVRDVLTGLELVATRTGAAVLVVHHSTKQDEESPLGGQDILGIPRSVLRVTRDHLSRVLMLDKKNLAPDAEEIRFDVVDRHGVGAVEWLKAPPPTPVETKPLPETPKVLPLKRPRSMKLVPAEPEPPVVSAPETEDADLVDDVATADVEPVEELESPDSTESVEVDEPRANSRPRRDEYFADPYSDREQALGRARQARARKTNRPWCTLPPAAAMPDLEQWKCLGCKVTVVARDRASHLTRCPSSVIGEVDKAFEKKPTLPPGVYPSRKPDQYEARAQSGLIMLGTFGSIAAAESAFKKHVPKKEKEEESDADEV